MWLSLVLWLSVASLGSADFCTDGTVCDRGTSCCWLPGGQIGCCPISQEVRDSLPMVPTGSWNDISVNLCTNKAKCPPEFTCLQKSEGSYGCCPFAKEAVSCDDGNRCCPEGFQCSSDGKLCTKRSGTIPVRAVICPDGESECPNGSTCCKMVDQSWGCCPMPMASCCDDKVHCCPHNSTCDVTHSRCISSEGEKPMWSKFAARKRAPWENVLATDDSPAKVICDDGSTCPGGTTCCKMPDGKYGCCPIDQAVCCNDHVHCCPPNTTCDLSHGKCSSEVGDTPLLLKSLALVSIFPKPWSLKKDQNVKCDDATFCPGSETCCRLASGTWGCCPLEKAVCCSDHIHCCPRGTTCDTEHGSCTSNERLLPWISHLQVKEVHGSHDVYCDATTRCSDRDTCCKNISGGWACCPLPQAVCCADHLHCCPNGYTCNVEQGTCLQGIQVIPWLTKHPAQVMAKKSQIQKVTCDDQVSCDDKETCCKDPGGKWACCPMPQAVCCSDHIHCCPNGYTCNVEQGTCSKGDNIVAMLRNGPPHLNEPPRSQDVPCDDTWSCPDGNTCCRTASGEWGCCPILKAVCCSDHIHCCPNGYTCNVEQGTCLKGDNVVTMLKKGQAFVKETSRSEDVPCDGTWSCPDGNTCCRTTSGEWGCCPILKAVCCSDHIHCCPNGYTCNVEQGTCSKGDNVVAMLKKGQAHMKATPRSEDVPCDDTWSCPDGSTCCRTTSGEWGCCPILKAVCCSDHIHCCPEGYTCNVEQGSCLRKETIVRMFNKIMAHKKEMRRSEEVPCDDTVSCPDSSTCCRTTSGDWGCCPSTDAVCCSDHIHCCPNGYTCDVEQGTCLQGDKVVAMITKIPVHMNVLPHSETVHCDDTASCPVGNTCCKTASGAWGCCPLVKAVCCSDHIHCCPNGYTCNVQQGTCLRGTNVLAMLKKGPVSIKEVPHNEGVTCDDGASCPDGNTCCRTVSGDWGCCPSVNAVCCNDHEHCCPSGHTCNAAQATCDKKDQSIVWLTKTASHVTNVAQSSQWILCDRSHTCPDSSTCCKTSTGSWSCCPLLQAVCCSDHIHCCPYGYTCDLVAQTCVGRDVSVSWHAKNAAHLKEEKEAQGNIPCDESTSCPSSSTCCKLVSGKWACCPLLRAVCCTDGLHCCPSGYRCAGDSCVQEKDLRWDGDSFGRSKMKIL